MRNAYTHIIACHKSPEWCDKNNIDTCGSKTKIMVFRNKNCPRPYNKVILRLKGEVIEEVDYYKILGTTVDNKLTFQQHYEKVIKAGYASLNQIKRFTVNVKVLQMQ